MSSSNGNINSEFNSETLAILVYFGCLFLQAHGILYILSVPSRNWNFCKQASLVQVKYHGKAEHLLSLLPGFLKIFFPECFKNLILFLICSPLTSSRPVVHFLTSMRFNPERIVIFQNSSIVTAKLCFNITSALPVSQQGNKWEL